MDIHFCFVLTHSWCFEDGKEGRYERTFFNYQDAVDDFEYLEMLMQVDDYEFNAVIPASVKGGLVYKEDLKYSIYERPDSFMNRQDLRLERREVSL